MSNMSNIVGLEFETNRNQNVSHGFPFECSIYLHRIEINEFRVKHSIILCPAQTIPVYRPFPSKAMIFIVVNCDYIGSIVVGISIKARIIFHWNKKFFQLANKSLDFTISELEKVLSSLSIHLTFMIIMGFDTFHPVEKIQKYES